MQFAGCRKGLRGGFLIDDCQTGGSGLSGASPGSRSGAAVHAKDRSRAISTGMDVPCRSRSCGGPVGRILLFLILLAALYMVGPARAGSVSGVDPDAAAQVYRQGIVALEAGRYDEARELLDEAVRLDPDFPGAWLDLAVATARVGDIVQAEEFLTILEARFDLPPTIAATVARWRARFAAWQVDPHPDAADSRPDSALSGNRESRYSLQMGAGYDSNANAGLSLGSLALTLPGGKVVLPIDDHYRPRSDTYTLLTAAAARQRNFGSGLLDAGLRVRWRRNRVEHDFDALEMRGSLAWTSPGAVPVAGLRQWLPGPWRVSTALQQVRLGGKALQNSVRLAFEHVWPYAVCRPLGAFEADFRTHPVARSIDATWLWLGTTLHCPGLPLPYADSLQARLRIGHAFARHGAGERRRPGGDSRNIEWILMHEWVWPSRSVEPIRLQAHIEWERLHDTRGYSPLLANGAVRRVDRTALGLSWSMPAPLLGDHWQTVVDVQQFRQRSNLAVFRLSGHLFQLSLQRLW